MTIKEHPDLLPTGKHLFVFHPGEATRNQPRWQFGLEENGRAGVILTYPISGLPWRYARKKAINFQVKQSDTNALFQNVTSLPAQFSQECSAHEELWADMAERGNAITRDKHSNSLCITVGITVRGQWTSYYALRDNSPALRNSQLYRTITELLEPFITSIDK